MDNGLIYKVLVEYCCGDSDMVLKVKDNSIENGYMREADNFEAFLEACRDVPRYIGWTRSSYDGVEIFSREQDTIYICGVDTNPSQYVEMEITIYGD